MSFEDCNTPKVRFPVLQNLDEHNLVTVRPGERETDDIEEDRWSRHVQGELWKCLPRNPCHSFTVVEVEIISLILILIALLGRSGEAVASYTC